MILVIDNYDSFTFNLVQYFGELSTLHSIAKIVRVERNDALLINEIKQLKPSAIILSPGPGNPYESGICLDILSDISDLFPILGVCLGHQAIAQVFGAKIVRAKQLMHGKTSLVHHDGKDLFSGLPQPLVATRYHSLIVDRNSLPECLEITAWLDDGTIMGLKHKEFSHVQGVQFHPESILTESGHQILSNFLKLAEGF
tara:strand:+ start:2263 stop:2859 length:597 start_codon:yes stop_codon:yes gene_type:complete